MTKASNTAKEIGVDWMNKEYLDKIIEEHKAQPVGHGYIDIRDGEINTIRKDKNQ